MCNEEESVHLRDFCEVVCRATFPNREGREALVAQTPKHRRPSMETRMGTKEIGDRLGLLQKAVSGKGLQIEYSPESDPGGAHMWHTWLAESFGKLEARRGSSRSERAEVGRSPAFFPLVF